MTLLMWALTYQLFTSDVHLFLLIQHLRDKVLDQQALSHRLQQNGQFKEKDQFLH